MPGGRLLILDDDAMVGQLLQMAAQSAGFEAQRCERHAAFFDAVRDWQPSHVAVDLLMPEMSGVEVLRQLAVMGCNARIIVSSGAGQGELDAALAEAQALGLQTAGVLPKPFSLAAVRALLKAG